uniref:ZP domain-containing protein n=1 Tax=Heterorhabditis bacteriophora TaxID=37862 RepID=A0A1I7X3H7_HETBA
MAATQTTTIETVSVVRPLKVISLVCLCIAIALSIVSLCSTWWLRSGSFRTGLFLECTSSSEPSHAAILKEAPPPGKCHAPARDSGYIKAVAALMIIALILTAFAFLLNICGLSKTDIRRKYIFYKFATYLAIVSVLLELTALIVFPACFYVKMKEYGSRRDWEECLNDGIRLHINPVGQFVGHVYVKGFFFGQSCHLDYCKDGAQRPFLMEIPYKGNCNVRRHRTPVPASITYEVTVVVQHHPLFITAGDRAYRLNCIYKQQNAMVSQKININGINLPSCRYDVLAGSVNGPTLHFANVGDPIVHKWTCQSDQHGLLVHSCAVRDEAGTEYKLIDERGCVIDSSLVPDVVYSSDLSMAHTTIHAFRFADQIMVHFACQITLCRKNEQGCEGITPPICRPIDFPPIHTEYKHASTPSLHNRQGQESNQQFMEKTTVPTKEWNLQSSTEVKKVTTDRPKTTSQEIYESLTKDSFPRVNNLYSSSLETPTTKRKEYGLEIHQRVGSTTPVGNINLVLSTLDPTYFTRPPTRDDDFENTVGDNGYSTHVLSSTFDIANDDNIEPLPYPAAAEIYYANRKTRSNPEVRENITLEVEAKKSSTNSSIEHTKGNYVDQSDNTVWDSHILFRGFL